MLRVEKKGAAQTYVLLENVGFHVILLRLSILISLICYLFILEINCSPLYDFIFILYVLLLKYINMNFLYLIKVIVKVTHYHQS